MTIGGPYFLFALAALIMSPFAEGSCKDSRPVLDVTMAVNASSSQAQPLYLPKSVDSKDLFPGIRLNIHQLPQQSGQVVFSTFFNFDDGLVSNDYAIYRMSYALMDGDHVITSADADFSASCERPQGHGVRAGETFHAAKFSGPLSTYAHPRIRIVVWGEMY